MSSDFAFLGQHVFDIGRSAMSSIGRIAQGKYQPTAYSNGVYHTRNADLRYRAINRATFWGSLRTPSFRLSSTIA